MNTIYQKIPFLRLALAFAIGIVVGSTVQLHQTLLLFCSLLLFLGLVILHRKYTFKTELYFGSVAFVLFIVLGLFRFNTYNINPKPFDQGTYLLTVLETPVEKENSYKALAVIESAFKNQKTSPVHEKAILYFEKSERVRTIQPGEQLLAKGRFQSIRNNGNPYEFNYQAYLANKQIFKQCYLKSNDWQTTSQHKTNPKILAEKVRNRLLHIYRSQNMGERETGILSALTLGYKQNLDRETKQTFTSAGVIHVLAVSGLHVGIIYLVLHFCLGFLKQYKTGRIVVVMATLLSLWVYAFITGLSPSVMRAATMFSLICIAENTNRRANIYNSLASSALLLLVLNPNNLYEVGFQLSYAAVFGIVYLQPRLSALFVPRNKIVRFFWSLLTVSVAAQICTFPLTAYYFNQFPSYFWISNLVVIPAVSVLIPLGLLLLLVSALPFLATAVSFCIQWVLFFCYQFLSLFEKLPKTTVNLTLSPFELVVLIFLLLFLLQFLYSKKARTLQFMLISAIVLMSSVALSTYQQSVHKELLVLNASSTTCVMVVNGRTATVISELEIDETQFLYRELKNISVKKRLKKIDFAINSDNYKNDYLQLSNGLLVFNNKQICFYEKEMAKVFKGDFLIGVPASHLNYIKNDSTQIIVKDYLYGKETLSNNIHALRTMGALQVLWK